MMANCSSLTLSLNQVVVSIKAVEDGGKTTKVLSDLWVLLDDVPPLMHNSHALMAFAELIGKPLSVDVSSLSHLGPVRMLISCVNLARVRGFVEILPGSSAYRIFVCVEGQPGENSTPPPPPPPPPKDDDRSKDDSLDESQESGPPFTQEEWASFSLEMQHMFKNRAPRGGPRGATQTCAAPGSPAAPAAPATELGVLPLVSPFSAVCSNRPACPASPSLSGGGGQLDPGDLEGGGLCLHPQVQVRRQEVFGTQQGFGGLQVFLYWSLPPA